MEILQDPKKLKGTTILYNEGYSKFIQEELQELIKYRRGEKYKNTTHKLNQLWETKVYPDLEPMKKKEG